jgi:hemoglobin-like flavoprotein
MERRFNSEGHPMDSTTVALVKESFGWAAPISEDAAAIFYARLFEMNPELKSLFKSDMKEQGRKLMATIAVVVNSLERLSDVLPAVQALAVRHAGYGVRSQDYDAVGNALIWTLETGLGERFTDRHKAAWAEVYTNLADIMRAAAETRSAAE